MRSGIRRNFLKIFLYLASVQSLLVAVVTALGESKDGGMAFGLSPARLLILILLTIAAFLFLIGGLNWGKGKKTLRKFEDYLSTHWNGFILVSFWLFVALTIVQNEAYFSLLLSGFRAVDVPNFYLRMRPILILGSVLFTELAVAITLTYRQRIDEVPSEQQTFFLWMLRGTGSLIRGGKPKRGGRKLGVSELWLGLLAWLGMLVLWLIIAQTKIGLIPDDRFWNVVGVPLLPQQVVLVLLTVFFLLDLKVVVKTQKNGKFYELVKSHKFFVAIMIVIWAAAVLVWNTEELRHTYFSPGPYPPNYEKYPFSDAATFDIGSQYFLLGEGLNDEVVTDRPFLMMFLAVLHMLGGQSYDAVVFVQILILAFIPVFLFVLGAKLHSKTFGVGLALLGILKEKNAIVGANEVGLANVKVLTSEMLMTLLVVMLATLVITWLEKENKHILWAILAGGVLGLSIGVKVTTLFLLPVLLVVTLWAYLHQRLKLDQWVVAGGLFVLSALVVIAPYSIDNIRGTGMPFWLVKISNAFDRSFGSSEDGKGDFLNKNEKLVDPLRTDENLEEELELPENVVTISLRHFVHNEIATLLMYPLSFEVVSLDQLVDNPFWDHDLGWQGELEGTEYLFLGMNLLFISIGIGSAFKRSGVSGLVPLIIHLGYNLTSGGARTSGGRYIVPVDWVIHVYFLLGVVSVVFALRQWRLAQQQDAPENWQSKIKPGTSLLVLVGFLAVGSSFMLTDLFVPEYPMSSGEPAVAYLQNLPTDVFREMEHSFQEVEAFSQSQGSYVGAGFSLYPRYYEPGELDKQSNYLSVQLNDVERLFFVMLTGSGTEYVYLVLEDQWLEEFPQAEFVIVIGCDNGDYIEGKVVLPVENEAGSPILSSDPGLTCN